MPWGSTASGGGVGGRHGGSLCRRTTGSQVGHLLSYNDMKTLSGHLSSWWWRDLSDMDRDQTRVPLPGDLACDIAIVGAGFTGLWTAYYLLERDPALRIAIIDQSVAGAGASGRNGGWCSSILPMGWDSAERLYGRQPVIAWQRAADATVAEIGRIAGLEGIEADISHGGYLRTASNPAQLAVLDAELADARRWDRTEKDLRRLDAQEARGVVDSPSILGALYTPHCYAIQPAKLVRGLARAVERRGGQIFEFTRALRIDPGRVHTEQGTILAEVVIRATEAYTADLPGTHRALLPMCSVMIATEPLPPEFWDEVGWRNRETFNDARRSLFYAQRTRDDRIAIGGRGAPYRYASRIVDAVPRLRAVESQLRAVLADQFPGLHGVEIEHRWGGILGVPRDWFPSVQFDRRTGLAAAGGYSGDGVTLTNLAGRTLADLITGHSSALAQLPWVGHHSRPWEPEPFRWIGASMGAWLATAADAAEEKRAKRSAVYGAMFSRLTGH
jgi:glycine/D-amino acid oxidase-like deaminating enzyme